MNIIQVPNKFRDLCGDWHGGQFSPFYAVSSSGTIEAHKVGALGSEARHNVEFASLAHEIAQLNELASWCDTFETVTAAAAALLEDKDSWAGAFFDRGVIELVAAVIGDDNKEAILAFLRELKDEV